MFDTVADTCRRAAALALMCPLIGTALACDDRQPGQPGAGTPAPATQGPQALRLAWSQAAPSATAIQGYSYVLFVDGARTTFAGATCTGTSTPTDFACSGPLPALQSGRRVLEISAVDPTTGLESPRSASLTVDIGSDGYPRPLLGQQGAPAPAYAEEPASIPASTCTAEAATACFTVSVIATDIAPVRRLLPLPDGRLLLLLTSGAITILPSGTSEHPQFAGARDGSNVDVVDVAIDPDFRANRFLYLVTIAGSPAGQRTVGVVRVRELADRVGEPATLVADLVAEPTGVPAIAIGPDRRVYLAMPGRADDLAEYGGRVLRFTPDGRADGNAQLGSPILAQGRERPLRLAWDPALGLLMASAESDLEPGLTVIPASAGSAQWPAEPIPVAGTITGPPNTGSSDLAAAPAEWGSSDVAIIAGTAGNPGALLLTTVTRDDPPEMTPGRTIPLGPLIPSTVAFADNGDLFVTANRSGETRAILLRLRGISSQRRP